MGAGMVKQGMGKNPRVVYAEKLSKRTGKKQLIDSSPLVKLDHGTLHYRYNDTEKVGRGTSDEKPHEGEERSRKLNYFYHAKLTDYGRGADYDKENDWKFKYVSEVPESSRKKKVFYIYGKGM